MKPISSGSPWKATGSDSRASPTSGVCAETVSSPVGERQPQRRVLLRQQADAPHDVGQLGAGDPQLVLEASRAAAGGSWGTGRRSAARRGRSRRARTAPGSGATLTLSDSSSPLGGQAGELLQRAGRHVDLEAGRPAASPSVRLLDAQPVGVGGDHPQLAPDAETRMPVSTGRVSSREAEPATFSAVVTKASAGSEIDGRGSSAQGTAGSPRREGCGCGRSRCPTRARRPARRCAARARRRRPAARGRRRASSRAGSTTTPSRSTSASSGTRRPTSMSVARSSQPSAPADELDAGERLDRAAGGGDSAHGLQLGEQHLALERDLHDEYL